MRLYAPENSIAEDSEGLERLFGRAAWGLARRTKFLMAYGLEWHSKTAGSGEWEELLAPIDCNYYSISGGAFEKCSDPDDTSTREDFAMDQSFAIRSPYITHSSLHEVRWKAGDHITWVKSASPLDLYFLR